MCGVCVQAGAVARMLGPPEWAEDGGGCVCVCVGGGDMWIDVGELRVGHSYFGDYENVECAVCREVRKAARSAVRNRNYVLRWVVCFRGLDFSEDAITAVTAVELCVRRVPRHASAAVPVLLQRCPDLAGSQARWPSAMLSPGFNKYAVACGSVPSVVVAVLTGAAGRTKERCGFVRRATLQWRSSGENAYW